MFWILLAFVSIVIEQTLSLRDVHLGRRVTLTIISYLFVRWTGQEYAVIFDTALMVLALLVYPAKEPWTLRLFTIENHLGYLIFVVLIIVSMLSCVAKRIYDVVTS